MQEAAVAKGEQARTTITRVSGGTLQALVLLLSGLTPICILCGWLAYLRFARWLVIKTGDSLSLGHAAELARAVRRIKPTPGNTRELD